MHAARCSLLLDPLHHSVYTFCRRANLSGREKSDDAPQKQTSQRKRRCVSLQRSFHRMHPCIAHESGSENTKIKSDSRYDEGMLRSESRHSIPHRRMEMATVFRIRLMAGKSEKSNMLLPYSVCFALQFSSFVVAFSQ